LPILAVFLAKGEKILIFPHIVIGAAVIAGITLFLICAWELLTFIEKRLLIRKRYLNREFGRRIFFDKTLREIVKWLIIIFFGRIVWNFAGWLTKKRKSTAPNPWK